MRRLTLLVALVGAATTYSAAFADPYTDPSIVDLRERPYLGELTRSTSFTEEGVAVPQFSREDLAGLSAQDVPDVANYTPHLDMVVPEPGTAALLALGLLMLGLRRRPLP